MKRTATVPAARTLMYTSDAAVIRYKARIDAKLADAKLGEAVEEENGLDEKTEIREARYTARFFADMLATGDDTPAIPSRVFRAIASYVNRHPDNLPHIEGAIVALKLAERSFTSALEMADQLDGEEIDPRYEQPYAALGTVRHYLGTLCCGAYGFDEGAALDAVLKKPRTLALAA
jgi:hypothetical protein